MTVDSAVAAVVEEGSSSSSSSGNTSYSGARFILVLLRRLNFPLEQKAIIYSYLSSTSITSTGTASYIKSEKKVLPTETELLGHYKAHYGKHQRHDVYLRDVVISFLGLLREAASITEDVDFSTANLV